MERKRGEGAKRRRERKTAKEEARKKRKEEKEENERRIAIITEATDRFLDSRKVTSLTIERARKVKEILKEEKDMEETEEEIMAIRQAMRSRRQAEKGRKKDKVKNELLEAMKKEKEEREEEKRRQAKMIEEIEKGKEELEEKLKEKMEEDEREEGREGEEEENEDTRREWERELEERREKREQEEKRMERMEEELEALREENKRLGRELEKSDEEARKLQIANIVEEEDETDETKKEMERRIQEIEEKRRKEREEAERRWEDEKQEILRKNEREKGILRLKMEAERRKEGEEIRSEAHEMRKRMWENEGERAKAVEELEKLKEEKRELEALMEGNKTERGKSCTEEEIKEQEEGLKAKEEEIREKKKQEKKHRRELEGLKGSLEEAQARLNQVEREVERRYEEREEARMKEIEEMKENLEMRRRAEENLQRELSKKNEEIEHRDECIVGLVGRCKKLEEEQDRIQRIGGDPYKWREEFNAERGRLTSETRKKEAERDEAVGLLFVGALCEAVRKVGEAGDSVRRDWVARFDTISDRKGIPRDWRTVLSWEEKKEHFKVRRRGETGMVFDESAYYPGAWELCKMLRNITAHMSNHGFREEKEIFEWVESKWPWFWPIFVQTIKEKGDDVPLRKLMFRKHMTGLGDRYAKWARKEEWGDLKAELMLIVENGTENTALMLSKTKEGGRPTENDERKIAKEFWEMVHAWYGHGQVRLRTWTQIMNGISKRNSLPDWRDECDEETKKMIGWEERKRSQVGEYRNEFADAIILMQRLWGWNKKKNKNNDKEDLEWARKKWPWLIAGIMATGMIHDKGKWGLTYEGRVNEATRREWNIFLEWWKGKEG